MNLSAALEDWRDLLGPMGVCTDATVAAVYGCDTGAAQRQIHAALRIQDGICLQEVMRIASRYRVPVYPVSTGHNWGYGSSLPVRDGCVILDLSALQKIIHFDAVMGVVTLEPGVTQGMLSEFLDAADHPFLVPVTGAGPSCSLLANALERGYGVTPHTDHFGAVTDLEAILPDGSLYRTALNEAGGEDLARLFKWGIGPYTAGLFTQAGFGIVTRVSIVLARRPECIKICFFGLKDDSLLEPATAAIRTLLTRLPGCVGALNLMNQHRVLSMTSPYPWDRTGSDGRIPPEVIKALGRQYNIMPWTGFVTLYGTRRMVAAAQVEMKMALSSVASRLFFITQQRAQALATLAQWIPGAMGARLARVASTLAQSLALVAGQPNETALPLAYWRGSMNTAGKLKNPARDGCGLIWYAPLVPMRPASVRRYVSMVQQITTKHRLEPLITLTSLNDRLFDSTVPLLFDKRNNTAIEAAHAGLQELMECGRRLGYFPYRMGIEAMPYWCSLQTHAETFQQRLRKDLDPHDLMAPGRYRR